MTHDDLLQQQAKAQAELTKWQRVEAEADSIIRKTEIRRRNAENQVAYYTGCLEQLAYFLRGFEDATNHERVNPGADVHPAG